jgi:two-component system phosphate regulon sensor histidine kinase PhoR
MVGWHTKEYTDTKFYLFLGVSFFFVGCTDFLHILTSEGMNVFPGIQVNTSIQLWIAARYIESVSLFVSPFLMKRVLDSGKIIVGYTAVATLLLASIFVWNIFPVSYIPGIGMTPFKIASEYVISTILICATLAFYTKRSDFERSTFEMLIISLLMMVLTEFSFAGSSGLYDIPDLLGHYFIIASYFILYRAVVNASLVKPYESLFRNLKRSEEWLRAHASKLESRKSDLEAHSESLLEILLDREERFRGIFDESPVSINVFDSEGVLIEANRSCLEMFGVTSPDDLRGFLLFEDPNMPDAARKRIGTGETVRFESRFDFSKVHESNLYETSKNGIMLLDTVVRPLRNADNQSLKGYLVQMQDITKQSAADDERNLSELRVEALLKLNQMKNATVSEIVNFALEEGIKVTKSQIGFFAFVSEDEKAIVVHSWSKSTMMECAVDDKPRYYRIENTGLSGEPLKQRKPVILNDYNAPNPAKRGYPIGHVEIKRFLGLPIFNVGKIVAVVGVGNKENIYDDYDVRQLTLLMEGMWRIMQQHRDEAEVRSAAETATLYLDLMGHDIRNSLQAIAMSADILKEISRDAEVELMLNIIQDSVKDSSDMIDKVQTTRGLIVAPLHNTSLNDSLQHAIDVIKRIYEDAIIDAQSKIENAVVNADEYLERLLINIMENGIQHNPRKERRLWVRLDAEQDGYMIRISDNGTGITDDIKETLLDPSRRFGGLGVHQATRIVNKYGGWINVYDRVIGDPSQGAEFFIWLPKSLSAQNA